MRTTVLAAIIAAIFVAMCLPVIAADPPPATKPAVPTGYVFIGGMYGSYEELFKACEPTQDQREKIAKIFACGEEAGKTPDKALRDAQQVLSKAYADKDKDAIAKASAEYTKLAMAAGEQRGKIQTDILAVLTADQKAKFLEYTTLKSVKQWYYGVTFSDAQWNKIMDAYEKLAKDSSIKPEQIMYKLRPKIEEILTPEQKAKRLMSTRYGMMNKACNFTDEQVKKIVLIEDDRNKEMIQAQEKFAARTAEMQKAWQEAFQSGDKEAIANVQKQSAENFKIYADLNKKYDDKVQETLTDKQKTAWQEEQKKWQQPGGGRGNTGGGAPMKPMGTW